MSYTVAYPIRALILFASVALAAPALRAETCTTQSALAPADRDPLAASARTLAMLVQSGDATALKSLAAPILAKDFAKLQYLVGSTAPKMVGDVITVDQLYILDATSLKPSPDGSAPDAQFYCSLNRTMAETEFAIPALPPGKYAFVIAAVSPNPITPNTAAAQSGLAKPFPWQLSFLLLEQQGKWLLAGFYPKQLTAAGHDGLWYWTHARQFIADRQPWNAWLYYQAAISLLQPAPFVNSTHLDKLRTEASAAAPPVLSEGISVDAPLVIKATDGSEYHFTGLGIDDSLGQSSLDIQAHLHVDPGADPVAARKRNDAAASALLTAYPELRKPFHGVWIFAEAAGQNPFTTEQAMSDIR